jgi:hypothetical protein
MSALFFISLLQTLLPVILGHTPAGASTRQLLHYGQEVESGKCKYICSYCGCPTHYPPFSSINCAVDTVKYLTAVINPSKSVSRITRQVNCSQTQCTIRYINWRLTVKKENKNKKFWEELIAYFPFTTTRIFDMTRTVQKHRAQQLFYCCLCICCRENIFTEPLPSNVSEETETYSQ